MTLFKSFVVFLVSTKMTQSDPNIISGRDDDFQTTLRIGVNFLVSDFESGISSCSWGIGKEINK